MTTGDFKGISLRTKFLKEIDQFISMPQMAGRYKSVTDFVTEATRLRLEELQKQYCKEE